ncbi:hypothetical protein QJS04_geneDACA022221 [Acorus gramineus]|uniref:Uncharacterized protein n=1 Tax=Acorus gramineus TaxID=55184 RepID=A0AAV9BLJ7_ACOGR|nr:hypothetical protein QJS04_geneDACA022221 [Acorus gramineus]
MGKGEDEQSLQAAAEGTSEGNAAAARRIGRRCRRIVRFRCVVAVVLGFAVVLSAVFWLPPFLRYPDHEGGDRDPLFED